MGFIIICVIIFFIIINIKGGDGPDWESMDGMGDV